MDKYIIDKDGNVSLCEDILEWGKSFEDDSLRVVKQDQVGDFQISTIFLGSDHRFDEDVPILFETKVFDKDGNDVGFVRYPTKQEALEGHIDMVQRIKEDPTFLNKE